MHSVENCQGCGHACRSLVLGPYQHLHDVVQLCEVHFERLTRGDRLAAVRGQGLEEVVGRHGGHL